MSDAVTIALISACSAIPTSVVGIASAYWAYKAAVSSRLAVKISKHTEQNTNHLKDELVALTHKAAHAEGVKQAEDAAARELQT